MKSQKPRSLMVLTPLPSSGLMHHEVHAFLSQLRLHYAQMDVPFYDQAFAGMDQPQCRAELLAFYYRNRQHFEDVIYLDADTVVTPETIMELGRLSDPIVCLPYEQRRRDEQRYQEGSIAHWTIDSAGTEARITIREGRRMMPVRGAGLGCCRIRREAVEKLWEIAEEGWIGEYATPSWESFFPGMEGTEVRGLFEPIAHEHVPGKRRRRSEDMSFFLRVRAAGMQVYALCDQTIWHDGKGGVSLWDALVTQERERARMRRRVDFELVACPDNLLGLHEVLDGAYDIPGLELEQGDRILDVGANIGAFAVWASKRFPGARLECYEPVPENFARLETNIAAAIIDDVTAHQVAVVGDEHVASVRIAPGRCNDGEWSIHDAHGVAHDVSKAIEVPAMPAKKLPPCALLKCDGEGIERELLEHYPHLKGCKAVMLEWHSVDDYRWIMEHMATMGFVPMVDRARGKPLPDRELCFIRRDVFLGKVEEAEREAQSNGAGQPEASP